MSEPRAALATAITDAIANADYDDTDSLTKAKAYRKALRIMGFFKPEEFHKAAQGGVDVARFTPTFLASEMSRVNLYISALQDVSNPGAGSVGLGIEPNFRGYQ